MIVEAIHPPCRPICGVFALRGIGELMALAASEDAPAIYHHDTLAAPKGEA
jgi:hypothetical protein